jgi:hypothetical protein
MHAIVYPAQWELKRDLADRYASLGVVASAADLYLELEMWDEVCIYMHTHTHTQSGGV